MTCEHPTRFHPLTCGSNKGWRNPGTWPLRPCRLRIPSPAHMCTTSLAMIGGTPLTCGSHTAKILQKLFCLWTHPRVAPHTYTGAHAKLRDQRERSAGASEFRGWRVPSLLTWLCPRQATLSFSGGVAVMGRNCLDPLLPAALSRWRTEG